MATKTYDATDGVLASTAANWVGGVAPITGGVDDVVFDATGAAHNCTWDLAITLKTFSMNAGFAAVVTVAAATNWGTTGDISIHAGTFTPVTSSVVTCAGSFVQDGGTITEMQLTPWIHSLALSF